MSASGIGGGKRNVNVELNLVPFIDLFSTLICFLLLTAVYQELESVSAGAAPTLAQTNQPNEPPPPPEKKVQLSVSLLMDHLELGEDDVVTKIDHVAAAPDYERFGDVIKAWHVKYPDRKDLVLNTDSRAPYKFLIGLMDTLITDRFPDVGINLN